MTVEAFNNRIKELELSRKDFAEKTNMAYSSVSNWHDEKKPIPGWVESWLENYAKSKTLDTIIDAIDKVQRRSI